MLSSCAVCWAGSEFPLSLSVVVSPPPQVWCCRLWRHLCISSCFWDCARGGPGAGHSTRCCSAVSVSCWPFSLLDTWLDCIYTSSSFSRKRFHPTTTTQGKWDPWAISWLGCDSHGFGSTLRIHGDLSQWQMTCGAERWQLGQSVECLHCVGPAWAGRKGRVLLVEV